MVIVVGGVKGGSGKTTIATNLAVMRAATDRKVLLIDADRQATASDFFAVRTHQHPRAPRYASLALVGRAFQSDAPRIVRRYNDVVIDTDGQDLETQKAALAIAQLLLVPFVPRSFDFWTLDRVVARVEDARSVNSRLRACAFLNRADTRRSANDDAEEVLAESGVLEVLPARLGSRKAFAVAASVGLGVTELRPPDAKAIEEAHALYACVFQEPAEPARPIKR